MSYLINNRADTSYITGSGEIRNFEVSLVERALEDVHKTIASITTNVPVNVFEILGMRNLSAFVGELFAKSVEKESSGQYISNPHQDGYPDLLLMDDAGRASYNRIKESGQVYDKGPFSPFKNGGIEVKATCGAVPTPAVCARRGFRKPSMGDSRIECVSGYDWKAHHRHTNNLAGLFWDFVDGHPEIVGVFFRSDLTDVDWGAIVQPREGGGRTTSVSIMTRAGVRKLYENWIAVKDDERYINLFNRYNRGDLIQGENSNTL